jgi:coenzyme F420-0:L-glutamate ligase/coenzyme F420-1:gamma-L-glutamate ligase
MVQIIPVVGIPLIVAGTDLAEVLISAVKANEFEFETGDIIVIAQKVVSKAEGSMVNLMSVTPSDQALELAHQTGRDPRLCQVYLDEASEVLEVKGRMVITRHRLGFQCSNSGVDRSNVASHAEETVVTLPRDPDESCRRLRDSIRGFSGKTVAVVMNDSFGRSDRDGSVGMAIGIAGIGHLECRDQRDIFGNPAKSRIALVDEIAAAGSMLMGQADERVPIVIIRGLPYAVEEESSIRPLIF